MTWSNNEIEYMCNWLHYDSRCLHTDSLRYKIKSHLICFKVLECGHINKFVDPLLLQQHFECSLAPHPPPPNNKQ